MSRKSETPMLTQFEAEVMAVLWKLGEGSVRDVLNRLPSDRKVAYTSVATILKILEEKNFVSSIKTGKTHTFVPRLEKENYQRKTLRHIIDQFFEGTTSSLVKNLVSDQEISENERAEIKRIIEEEL